MSQTVPYTNFERSDEFPEFYDIPPHLADELREPIVDPSCYFVLPPATRRLVNEIPHEFGYGELGNAVYYGNYSRIRTTPSGRQVQETWKDTCIRCIEGCMTFRKYHHKKENLPWDEEIWQKVAAKMYVSMYKLEWSPPGRGLWACGTKYCYERGAACLTNCAVASFEQDNETTRKDSGTAFSFVWAMDMLTTGVGVGEVINFQGDVLDSLEPGHEKVYQIPDNREGWAHSVGILIAAYLPRNGKRTPLPIFDYSKIRPRGLPLRGFGGESSGPQPLIDFHRRIRIYFEAYQAYSRKPSLEVFCEMVEKSKVIDYDYIVPGCPKWLEMEEAKRKEKVEESELQQVVQKEADASNFYTQKYVDGIKDMIRGKSPVQKLSDILNVCYSLLEQGTFLPEETKESLSVLPKISWLEVEESVEVELPLEVDSSLLNWLDFLKAVAKLHLEEVDKVRSEEVESNVLDYTSTTFTTGLDKYFSETLAKILDLAYDLKDLNLVGQREQTKTDANQPEEEETDVNLVEQEEKICETVLFGSLERAQKFRRDLHNLLITFHNEKDALQAIFHKNVTDPKAYDRTRLIADLFNGLGICVISGNIRRSAEIMIHHMGDPGEKTFLELKNYIINPERGCIGWMSNNSLAASETEHFEQIPKITKRIQDRGEPGFINLRNMRRFGRVGKTFTSGGLKTREDEPDPLVIGPNPCLTADTLILTDAGEKTIQELIGVPFMPINPLTQEYMGHSLEGFWSTGVKEVFEITLHSGDKIRATANHRFGIPNKTGKVVWRRVDQLSPGDNMTHPLANSKMAVISQETPQPVQIKNGEKLRPEHLLMKDSSGITMVMGSVIKSIVSKGEEEVYDCTVEGSHSFYANGFLSHNCGEIGLEKFETCILSETYPTRCKSEGEEEDIEVWYRAVEYATIYASSVALLPYHWKCTNEVIVRNRRIGVAITGLSTFCDKVGTVTLTRYLREGYRRVRVKNKKLAKEAGVVESIRTTSIKPSGTVSLLAGSCPGMHYPVYGLSIRTLRKPKDSVLAQTVIQSGYYYEDALDSKNTVVISFPIDQSDTRSVQNVSVREQIDLLRICQSNWSDNAVSVTAYFHPKEEGPELESIIGGCAPYIKSISCLPHTRSGVYKQAPFQESTKEEYEAMVKKVGKIDWSLYGASGLTDGEDQKYCTGESCLASSQG